MDLAVILGSQKSDSPSLNKDPKSDRQLKSRASELGGMPADEVDFYDFGSNLTPSLQACPAAQSSTRTTRPFVLKLSGLFG
jgi:hypothetical protein